MWDMTYGDELKSEILRMSNPKQRAYFFSVFLRMEKHIYEHDEDSSLTFKEYFEMYER